MRVNDIVLCSFTTGMIPAVILGQPVDGLLHVRHIDVTTGCGFAEAVLPQRDCFLLTSDTQQGPSPVTLGNFCDLRIPESQAYQFALVQRTKRLGLAASLPVDAVIESLTKGGRKG